MSNNNHRWTRESFDEAWKNFSCSSPEEMAVEKLNVACTQRDALAEAAQALINSLHMPSNPVRDQALIMALKSALQKARGE